MDKYKAAVMQYALFQQRVKHLTDAISQPQCSEVESGKKWPCIEFLWDRNRDQKEEDKEFSEPDILPIPNMCDGCKELQSMIDQRKDARKNLGIAKIRIANLGRKLVEYDESSLQT